MSVCDSVCSGTDDMRMDVMKCSGIEPLNSMCSSNQSLNEYDDNTLLNEFESWKLQCQHKHHNNKPLHDYALEKYGDVDGIKFESNHTLTTTSSIQPACIYFSPPKQSRVKYQAYSQRNKNGKPVKFGFSYSDIQQSSSSNKVLFQSSNDTNTCQYSPVNIKLIVPHDVRTRLKRSYELYSNTNHTNNNTYQGSTSSSPMCSSSTDASDAVTCQPRKLFTAVRNPYASVYRPVATHNRVQSAATSHDHMNSHMIALPSLHERNKSEMSSIYNNRALNTNHRVSSDNVLSDKLFYAQPTASSTYYPHQHNESNQ